MTKRKVGRELTEVEKGLLKSFMDSLHLMSPSRKRKYQCTVYKIAREQKKPIGEISNQDLKEYLERKNKEDLRDSTKRDYVLFSKILFRKLRGKDFVDFIVVPPSEPTVTADQLLTTDELDRLREAAKTTPK